MSTPAFQANYDPWKSYMVSGQTLNDIAGILQRLTPIAGAGIEIDERPTGRVFRSTAEASAASGPLTAYVDGGKIKVTPGWLNGEMPEIGGVALTAATPPALTPPAGTSYLHLKADWEGDTAEIFSGYSVNTAAGVISNARFEITGSAETSDDYPTSGSSGTLDVVWCEITNTGGAVEISVPSGSGHGCAVFFPPANFVVFRANMQ